MLINRDGYRDMAREFLGSRALIYLAGILAFVPGLAMVLAHNVWVADWRIVITFSAGSPWSAAPSASCFRRRSRASARA